MKNACCLLLLIAGCSPQATLRDTRLLPGELAGWNLVADQRLVLRDPQTPDIGYPNPNSCEWLSVVVTSSGRVCGTCHSAGAELEACGGVEVGLPYSTAPLRRQGRLDLAIIDFYGKAVRTLSALSDACVTVRSGEGTTCSICTDAQGQIVRDSCAVPRYEPVDDDEADLGHCVQLQVAEGQVCKVCADERGFTTFNDCEELPQNTALDETGPDETSADDGDPPQGCYPVAEQADCVLCYDSEGGASMHCGDIDDGTIEENPTVIGGDDEACFDAGVAIYIERVNATLGQMGLPESGLTEEAVANSAYADDLATNGLCVEMEAYIDEDREDTAVDPARYVGEEDGIICGLIGLDNALFGCWDLPADCLEHKPAYYEGVEAAYRVWAYGTAGIGDGSTEREYGVDEFEPNPELPDCVSSPLVLDLRDDVSLTRPEHGVSFDLLGLGHPVQTGWVGSGQLLGLDLDGDGAISSGRELFGEATRLPSGLTARDGFAALAQYDQRALGGNANGRLDVGDVVYHHIVLWEDRDMDGQSHPTELHALSDAGVREIDLSRGAACFPRTMSVGNTIGLVSSFVDENGRVGEVYDVWFRYRPATDHSS